MVWLDSLVRSEILRLKPYSSARNEYINAYGRTSDILLDANENPKPPYGHTLSELSLNRYPEPQPTLLKRKLADMYVVNLNQVMITRGMDEGIDLLMRLFCIPYQDKIIITPPTFGYYSVAANIHGIEVKEIPLLESMEFMPNMAVLSRQQDAKLIFLCTPNNPTGTIIPLSEIRYLCQACAERCIIVVDEAYIEFSEQDSATTLLAECNNLIVMRTLSKAYGLAGARIGSLIAAPEIIALLAKIMPPYPIPSPSVNAALESLSPIGFSYTASGLEEIKRERTMLAKALTASSLIDKVYPSHANFLLVKSKDANKLYECLKSKGVIVRRFLSQIPDALRISVGSPKDNRILLEALGLIEPSLVLPRESIKSRKTNETEVMVRVKLDNCGRTDISTGIGFFDHMLDQFSKHSGISMQVKAIGDTHIDAHHTIEDVAIVLGQALNESLKDKRGINRYGFLLPMDESRAQVSIDLSGRGYCHFDANFTSSQVGNFPVEMVKHFFMTLSANLKAAIHIIIEGDNTHHMIESCFKAFARALKVAIARTSEQLPSTKGVL